MKYEDYELGDNIEINGDTGKFWDYDAENEEIIVEHDHRYLVRYKEKYINDKP